jgi:hypothetical protein
MEHSFKFKFLVVICVILVVVVVVMAVYIVSRTDPVVEIVKKETRQDIERIEKDVKTLHARQVMMGARQSTSLGSSEEEVEEERRPPTREELELAQKHMEMEIEFLDRELSRQKKDPEWSTRTEDVAWKVFKSTDFEGAELNSVECGSTFCAADIDFTGSAEQKEDQIRLLTQTEPWNTHGKIRFVTPDNARVYFGRRGRPIPNMDEN